MSLWIARGKNFAMYMGISLAVPLLLLLIATQAPPALAKPGIEFAILPMELFNFDTQTLNQLTVFVFGSLLPNYAPIQIVILFIFWFCVSLGMALLFKVSPGISFSKKISLVLGLIVLANAGVYWRDQKQIDSCLEQGGRWHWGFGVICVIE
ncbi:hypothetical protein [Methylomonas sp. AM2-LC]|uniref:hypothetical protein n=1 Tax=Methylomonas sp. AM2-LC TaxID=3153301 RepID=UPI003264258D